MNDIISILRKAHILRWSNRIRSDNSYESSWLEVTWHQVLRSNLSIILCICWGLIFIDLFLKTKAMNTCVERSSTWWEFLWIIEVKTCDAFLRWIVWTEHLSLHVPVLIYPTCREHNNTRMSTCKTALAEKDCLHGEIYNSLNLQLSPLFLHWSERSGHAKAKSHFLVFSFLFQVNADDGFKCTPIMVKYRTPNPAEVKQGLWGQP